MHSDGRMKTCDMETTGQWQTARTLTHLEYQPLVPIGDKYLQQKWAKFYDLHRAKIKTAKPTINTTPPKTYGHLTLKRKKQKLEEERITTIQRENNMLMEKISHIMRTTGGVDNRNHYDRKSLGKEKRQVELLRITMENQTILFRLSQCRPNYSVRSWQEDWLKTLKVMDSIARYPRGRANVQKEKPIKKGSDCEKQGHIRDDTMTHRPTSSKINCKSESGETDKKEISKK